jgi:hypothetical protein
VPLHHSRSADALPHARSSTWLTHHSPSAFLAAAGLLATTGALVITEDRIGVTLFPAALTALSMGAIALAAALATLSLALGLFLALLSSGAGAWRTGIPTRGVGLALVLAAVPFVVPTLFAVTGLWMGELIGLGLFVTWTAFFGGIGLVLRGG